MTNVYMTSPDEINAVDAETAGRVARTLFLKEMIISSMEYNPWAMPYDIRLIDVANDETNRIDDKLRSRLEHDGTRTIEEAQRMRLATLLDMNYTDARNYSIADLIELHGQTENGSEAERQMARERLGLAPVVVNEEIESEPAPQANNDNQDRLEQARTDYEAAKRRAEDGFVLALVLGAPFAAMLINDKSAAEARLVAAAREATIPAPSRRRRHKIAALDRKRGMRFSMRNESARMTPSYPARRKRYAGETWQPSFMPDED
jgi:hypothetical protein